MARPRATGPRGAGERAADGEHEHPIDRDPALGRGGQARAVLEQRDVLAHGELGARAARRQISRRERRGERRQDRDERDLGLALSHVGGLAHGVDAAEPALAEQRRAPAEGLVEIEPQRADGQRAVRERQHLTLRVRREHARRRRGIARHEPAHELRELEAGQREGEAVRRGGRERALIARDGEHARQPAERRAPRRHLCAHVGRVLGRRDDEGHARARAVREERHPERPREADERDRRAPRAVVEHERVAADLDAARPRRARRRRGILCARAPAGEPPARRDQRDQRGGERRGEAHQIQN